MKINDDDIMNRSLIEAQWLTEPIVYEFTDDRALLHQYYQLREHMYRKVHGVEKFSGKEDVYDKVSHILIARKGRLCIGGCRLTIRNIDEEFLLPLEADVKNFSLKNLLPEYALDRTKHGEISRFAVMEGFNQEEVMRNLCRILCEKSISMDANLLFAKSPATLARNWRRIATQYCGMQAKILANIHVPENPLYPEIKWYLSSFDNHILSSGSHKTELIELPALLHF